MILFLLRFNVLHTALNKRNIKRYLVSFIILYTMNVHSAYIGKTFYMRIRKSRVCVENDVYSFY